MAINKSLRQQVYDKFKGKCAYTGKPLCDDWEPDHLVPKYLFEYCYVTGDPDHIDNLMPSLKIVNRYKGGLRLESFRNWYLGGLHERLKKLPKKTSVPATQRKKDRLHKIARLFRIDENTAFDGTFYFERIKFYESMPLITAEIFQRYKGMGIRVDIYVSMPRNKKILVVVQSKFSDQRIEENQEFIEQAEKDLSLQHNLEVVIKLSKASDEFYDGDKLGHSFMLADEMAHIPSSFFKKHFAEPSKTLSKCDKCGYYISPKDGSCLWTECENF